MKIMEKIKDWIAEYIWWVNKIIPTKWCGPIDGRHVAKAFLVLPCVAAYYLFLLVLWLVLMLLILPFEILSRWIFE
jgi:hypothetical protein